MKVSEAKFTRRYNVGQYEHEEFTVTAQLEEDDNVVEALAELKADVQKAFAGECSTGSEDEAGTDTEEETEDTKPAKPSKKSKKSRTTAPGDELEEEEDTTAEEKTEDEDGGDETEEETESEESEDETEEEDTKPAKGKKAPAKKTPSTAGAKGSKFKKKPQVYQRANETHKDLFSAVLRKAAPNWKKSFESKAHAKKVSQKLEGKEFLNEDGKVLPSFEAEVKKAMGKFGK